MSTKITENRRSELPLDKYRTNLHSSNGEDGVIQEILRRIGLTPDIDLWCVEFGAWDGISGSNTFALVERSGFRAVYIEGDESRYANLLKTAEQHTSIIPINAYVSRTIGDSKSLDALLARTPLPERFAVLSIDIDGFDLDVWESLTLFVPMIVVIEINSSIPPGIIWRHSEKTPGNTFTATCAVAKVKGYSLVCHTGNLIFVHNDLIAPLRIPARFLEFPELLFLFDNQWLSPRRWQSRKTTELRLLRQLIAGVLPKRMKSRIRALLSSP